MSISLFRKLFYSGITISMVSCFIILFSFIMNMPNIIITIFFVIFLMNHCVIILLLIYASIKTKNKYIMNK